MAIFAIAAVAFAVYFEPTCCVRGWLHGEAFYEGRPTSWWRQEVLHDFDRQPPTLVDRVATWLGKPDINKTTIQLVGRPEAKPVLEELAKDEHPVVARFGSHFLSMLGTEKNSDFDRNVEWVVFLLTSP